MRLKTPHLKVGLFETFWMEFVIEQEPKSGDWWQSFDTLWFFGWGLRNIHLRSLKQTWQRKIWDVFII